MNKSEYRAARKVIRANGNFALRWLQGEVKEVMIKLNNQKHDNLRSRKIFFSEMQPISIKQLMIKDEIIRCHSSIGA